MPTIKPANLRKRTPRKWRRFGNALAAAGTAAAAYAFISDTPGAGWVIVGLTIVGKFISEMTSNEK